MKSTWDKLKIDTTVRKGDNWNEEKKAHGTQERFNGNCKKIALKLKWHSKWIGKRRQKRDNRQLKSLAIARNTDSQLCSVRGGFFFVQLFVLPFLPSKSVNECKQQQKYKFSIYDVSFERCLFRCRFLHLECFLFFSRKKYSISSSWFICIHSKWYTF